MAKIQDHVGRGCAARVVEGAPENVALRTQHALRHRVELRQDPQHAEIVRRVEPALRGQRNTCE
eukprot:11199881-Lingulodinium_polyedra.AAC.1